MKAELLYHFGDDLMVSNVARVSYGKAKEIFDEKDERLLKYLVEHKHTSPFRHPQLQFRISCPIFVERQIRKHEVGIEVAPIECSINSISGRYVDFSDSYYEITEFRQQSKSSKQGSAENLDSDTNKKAVEIYNQTVEECKNAYQKLLDLGVAKEMARCLLPMSLETQFIWTGSFFAFVHLCNLRLKPDAQLETRNLVQSMLDCVKSIPDKSFEYSLNAFGLCS
jgi:thymidylate synthase (FAD)